MFDLLSFFYGIVNGLMLSLVNQSHILENKSIVRLLELDFSIIREQILFRSLEQIILTSKFYDKSPHFSTFKVI